MAGWVASRQAHRLAALVVAASLLASVPALAEVNKALDRGIRLLNDMDDRKALRAFDKALKLKGNTAFDRARIHLYMGLAYNNLLRPNNAVESFKKALSLDPGIELPAMTSPKTRALFEAVKAEHTAAARPPAGSGGEGSPPAGGTGKATAGSGAAGKTAGKDDASGKATSAAATPPPRGSGVAKRPRPAPRPARPGGGYRIAAFVTLGLAVAAGGTGLGMGLWARTGEDEASDRNLTYPEAEALHDKAKNRALLANVALGVAGAAAVVSGVMFYLGYRSPEVPATAASVAPLPGGGALLQVRTVAW